MVDNPSARGRILIVDDSDLVLRALMRSANYFGYHVTSAASYQLAVSCLKTGSFELVLSDIDLGDHYGTELLKEISKLASTTQPPLFIFMTGNPALLDQAELKSHTVLTKPFSAIELQTILQQHLK